MKKIKVSEATGAALDWLVENAELLVRVPNPEQRASIASRNLRVRGENGSYSLSWAQGGPIIDREKIYCLPPKEYHRDVWVCTSLSGVVLMGGDTLLIAAMRCYVASKLGDEVEVPEELL